MRTPPYLIGATLVFWSWQTGHWLFGLGCAVVAELARTVKWRWDFSEAEMCRVWDLCMILFAVVALYSYAITDLAVGSYRVIPWAPVLLFPFLAANAYSARDVVRFKTYFWLWRRKGRNVAPHKELGWFVPYWYFTICFISASLANVRDGSYFVGVILLGGWFLWEVRNRSVPVWAWSAVLMVMVTAAAASQIGMVRMQWMMERMVGRVMVDMFADDTEILQTRTAIGMVGALKLSNRIVMRVTTHPNQPAPERLRTATFDTCISDKEDVVWSVSASPGKFAETSPGVALGDWHLATTDRPTNAVTVAMFMPRKTGILPVPNGPSMMHGLYADAVETNAFGSIRVKEGLSLVRYTTDYTGTSTLDAAPTDHDLKIPKRERDAVQRIVTELGLEGQSTDEILRRVQAFFVQGFTYRTYQKPRRYGPLAPATPLARFLLEDRAGHCEYFAAATTLLLRAAGIPTRYAIGYGLPEASPGETINVRGKDGHAWTLIYRDGTWHDFDTTPAGWSAFEQPDRSIIQRASDFMSLLRYQFLSWRYYTEQSTVMKILFWALIPVLGWLLWRIFGQQRRVKTGEDENKGSPTFTAGRDSEFYRIEQHLAQTGHGRQPGEPLGEWISRLEKLPQPVANPSLLRSIVNLHYAYRFDPEGIIPEQRGELRKRVEQWLSTEQPQGQRQ
jgi:hypothetical protein